jgi:hypothetical protein
MTFRPARALTELYQAVKPEESLPPDDERHVNLCRCGATRTRWPTSGGALSSSTCPIAIGG